MLKLSINKPISFVLLVLLILAGCKKSENPIPVEIVNLGMDSPEGKITRKNEASYNSSTESTVPKVVMEDGRFKIYAGFKANDSLIFIFNDNVIATYYVGNKQDSYAIVRDYYGFQSTLESSSNMGSIAIVGVDRKKKTISGYYTLNSISNYGYEISGQFNNISYTEKNNIANTFSYKSLGKFRSLTPTITIADQKIYIDGFDKSGEKISLTINGTEEGNYYFGSSNSTNYGYAYLYSGSTYYYTKYGSSYSGYFQLSEVDINNKTITGNFGFFGSDGYSQKTTVTEGTIMKIPYIVSSTR
jgi:hypothetical protein